MEISDSPSENYRNWLELARDITLMILMKLQRVKIMESVQFVCKPWYDLCKEPVMWRTIYFKDLDDVNRILLKYFEKPKLVLPNLPNVLFNHEQMVFNAIDRSSGGLVDLDIEGFVPQHLCSASSYCCSKSLACINLWFESDKI
ncbi:hypothetical protein RND81_07G165700 [Saponaria officinalis]|uniref:F-box domain-containing protein n=1 Tax=Saponaria officinalis TaxID=3572 RepID=A0AAW1JP82_SAPOF